jgi:hypothetical protein
MIDESWVHRGTESKVGKPSWTDCGVCGDVRGDGNASMVAEAKGNEVSNGKEG